MYSHLSDKKDLTINEKRNNISLWLTSHNYRSMNSSRTKYQTQITQKAVDFWPQKYQPYKTMYQPQPQLPQKHYVLQDQVFR